MEKVLNMKKIMNREITSIDEYVQWVKDWRDMNIQWLAQFSLCVIKRTGLRQVPFRLTIAKPQCNKAYSTKLSLRPYAKEMYDIRVENKARFKAGEFGDPNFHPREVATA